MAVRAFDHLTHAKKSQFGWHSSSEIACSSTSLSFYVFVITHKTGLFCILSCCQGQAETLLWQRGRYTAHLQLLLLLYYAACIHSKTMWEMPCKISKMPQNLLLSKFFHFKGHTHSMKHSYVKRNEKEGEQCWASKEIESGVFSTNLYSQGLFWGFTL